MWYSSFCVLLIQYRVCYYLRVVKLYIWYNSNTLGLNGWESPRKIKLSFWNSLVVAQQSKRCVEATHEHCLEATHKHLPFPGIAQIWQQKQ